MFRRFYSTRCRRAGLSCRSFLVGATFFALILSMYFAPTTRAEQPYIVVGRQSDLLDQPYVRVELSTYDEYGQEVGIGPYDSGFGVYDYNMLLLDTGANSALIVSDAAADLYNYGYQTEGFYYEQGVAGFSTLNVSAPYNLRITGTDDTSVFIEQTTDQARILSNKDMHLGDWPASYGGFTGLVGMPAMIDRVTTFDFTDWFDIPDIYEMSLMGVSFPTVGPTDPTPVLPADNGHRYSIEVDTRYLFDPADGLAPDAPPDAPLPVWAPIPFLTAKAQYHDANGAPIISEGDFLFDSGAQMSLLTRDMAFSLGLDEDGDGTFLQENLGTMAVGGIGGTVDAEMLMIDKLILPTEQGVDLVWEPQDIETEGGLLVLVLPEGATQLPFSVFGADFMTGGISMTIDETTLEVTIDGNPYFEQIQLDFRQLASEGTGTIYFDLNPDIDQIITPPTPSVPGDANNDGRVNSLDAAVLSANWGQSVSGGALNGDFNGDGAVNAKDASILAANWGVSDVIPGDANDDGKVDDLDAAILGTNWGQGVQGGASEGDFNGDGVVNAKDASILAANWGGGAESFTPGGAVPEPTGLVLLMGLLATLLVRRGRRNAVSL